MAGKNADKRCPACAGEIDYFGSCRKCGRAWSEALEPGERALGLPEGEQHDPGAPAPDPPKRGRASRFAKSGAALRGEEFAALAGAPERFGDWQISDRDGDTEIVRKRALMRRDSRKAYNAAGLSVRAHDNLKAAMLFLGGLGEYLDDSERAGAAEAAGLMRRAYEELGRVRQAKVADAAAMEVALEKAHRDARRARLRQADAARKRAAKEIAPGEDTEGMSVPEPVALPPGDLLDDAKRRLAALDEERAARKKGRRPPEEQEQPE